MGRLYRHATVPDLLFYHIGTQSLTPEKHQITPRISGPSKVLCRHSDGKYRGKAERRVSLCCLCFSFRSQRLAQPVTAALTDRTDGGGDTTAETTDRMNATETLAARYGYRHLTLQSRGCEPFTPRRTTG